MNTEPSSGADMPPPDTESSAPHGWSDRAHAALPAQPLGPKAAALHARRMLHLATRPGRLHPLCAGVRFSTADAALSYLLRGVGSALYLERTQRRPLGTHIVQSMVFASLEEFMRWSDADPVRFDEPNLHHRLRRQGQEYFDGSR